VNQAQIKQKPVHALH